MYRELRDTLCTSKDTYNMLHSLGIWDVCLLCIGYCTAPSDGKQPEYFLRAEKSLSGLPSSTLYVKVLQTYLLQSQRLLIVRGKAGRHHIPEVLGVMEDPSRNSGVCGGLTNFSYWKALEIPVYNGVEAI